jgi:hypothetical protein
LASFDPDIVVVATAGWDLVERRVPGDKSPRTIGDPVFDAWLVEQLEEGHAILSETGAHVAWLTVPCVYSEKFENIGVFRPERPKHYNSEILPRVAESHRASMTVLDLFSAICPEGLFAQDAHGMRDFRPDGIHFSQEGTRWVGAWLGGELVPLGARVPRTE